MTAGCASHPETSRATATIGIVQPQQLSALSRRFRAETPYFVNFDFDADSLDADAMARLDRQAEWIIDHPHVKFRAYGHADKVGTTGYNDDLGMRRALRVVAYLTAKGIEHDRLEAVVSYGEDAPLVDTEARERLNRRVVTEVFGFVVPAQAQAGVRAAVPAAALPVAGEVPPAETGTESETAGAGTDDSGKHPNAGRGNGDETGDPGKSGGHNKGGDEAT